MHGPTSIPEPPPDPTPGIASRITHFHEHTEAMSSTVRGMTTDLSTLLRNLDVRQSEEWEKSRGDTNREPEGTEVVGAITATDAALYQLEAEIDRLRSLVGRLCD
jgi:L-alanine-DL-glutamate epimerase-like enolase superfamily enzyme